MFDLVRNLEAKPFSELGTTSARSIPVHIKIDTGCLALNHSGRKQLSLCRWQRLLEFHCRNLPHLATAESLDQTVMKQRNRRA